MVSLTMKLYIFVFKEQVYEILKKVYAYYQGPTPEKKKDSVFEFSEE